MPAKIDTGNSIVRGKSRLGFICPLALAPKSSSSSWARAKAGDATRNAMIDRQKLRAENDCILLPLVSDGMYRLELCSSNQSGNFAVGAKKSLSRITGKRDLIL